MLTFIHRVDPSNLGDSVCCPVDYFDWSFTEHRVIDIHKPFESEFAGNYIFGGGGLLHGQWLERLDKFAALKRRSVLSVMWSAGMNVHFTDRLIWPKFLDTFNKVGLRDWGNPWEYLPCVSCLHPAVKEARGVAPIYDVVVYEHKNRKIDIPSGLPGMNNEQAKDALPDVISFLASGRVVITNSFHGAYWTLLLGRVPLVFSPYSNRFFSFKRRLSNCEWYNWRDALEDCLEQHGDSDYYRECVTLNLDFFEGVKSMLP